MYRTVRLPEVNLLIHPAGRHLPFFNELPFGLGRAVYSNGSVVNQTAKSLLDRWTRKEISTEEFFRLANELPDRELELLSELLRQRRVKARRRQETE